MWETNPIRAIQHPYLRKAPRKMDEYTDTNTENISDEPALDFDERPEKPVEYIEDDIKTLDWREHIRLRPGMYIGKLGDGSYNDDGI